MDTLWGIDLGGTKIEGIILDKGTLSTIARMRVPTEGKEGYEHVLHQIKKLVSMLEAESGLRATTIGMGTPGIQDPIIQQMKNCNTTALNGKNLQSDISALIGIPFKLSNDANCFAIAEANMGVVAEQFPEAKVVFGVILGTGVGGGIVINGGVLNGRHGISGEWGHNFLDSSGGPCYCGKVGCVETVLAGPALEKYYAKISGHTKSLKDIVLAYRANTDEHATATLERLFFYFGKAMAVVVNILDPDVIVIGGGAGNIDEIYTHGVEEVKKHLFNHRLDTVFYKPKLGDSAGVFGAAFL